jgi:hypothetical protein
VIPPESNVLSPHISSFEQLVAVASLLPDGWRLEATASMVRVTWSA